MLFTGIDSLTYKTKSEDTYEKLFKHNHLLDFSNYTEDAKFFDSTNQKVIRKMKDASEEKIIGKFVGLKSKMYSIKNLDGKESNTAKGVNIVTEFNELKDTLFNQKALRHKMKIIQCKKHTLETYEINKISLSCFDDKRFLLYDEIHMLAFFHKYIDSHR